MVALCLLLVADRTSEMRLPTPFLTQPGHWPKPESSEPYIDLYD
jgi:hypothetical protein